MSVGYSSVPGGVTIITGYCRPCDPTCSGQKSTGPINYSDGRVSMTVTDLSSVGFGGSWSHKRSYHNVLPQPKNYGLGMNWMVVSWPHMVIDSYAQQTGVTFGPDKAYAFDTSGAAPVALHGQQVRLTFNTENRHYTYWEPDGSYYCYAESGGYFRYARLANGEILVANVCSGPSGERISRIERSLTSDDVTYREAVDYTYSGDLVTSAVLKRYVGGGQWSELAKVEYTYHTDPALGTTDSLRTAQRKTFTASGWVDAGTYYYRYYPALEGGNLKYALEPQAYEKLMADPEVTDPDAASDAKIAQYACYYFEYDYLDRVTKERVLGGSMEYGFQYFNAVGSGYNGWTTRTTETLPNGATRVVYSNSIGYVLLKELHKGDSSWVTYNRYDEDTGRLILEASPSAVAGYTASRGTLSVTLHQEKGLIRKSEYNADGYKSAEYRLAGENAYSQKLRSYFYASYLRTGSLPGEPGIVVPSTTRVHYHRYGVEYLDTTYAYQWHPGTYQMSRRTTTLPAVFATQNGPDTATTRVEQFDLAGNLIESQDEAEHVVHHSYNLSTGLRTRTDELQQITDYEGDQFGRVVQVLGLGHEVDGNGVRRAAWTVYKDQTHEVWSAQGYVGFQGQATLVNPVSISKLTIDGRALESIQAVRASTSGALSASDEFPQSSYVRWTTYGYQHGRLARTRVYHAIPASGEGLAGDNYAETLYGYDGSGRQNYVKTPGGTITRTVFDARDQQAAVYVGTNDAGATEADPTGNGNPDNNLVLVMSYQYDAGFAGGDGLLTQVTQHVDASTQRSTSFQYDGFNRRVITTAPDGSTEQTWYDNLDRIERVKRYSAQPEGRLLAQTDLKYDNLDRQFQTLVYGVDPATGDLENALVGNTWYDKVGRVIKQQAPGALAFAKFVYDGYGRRTAAYLAYDDDETTWAEAASISGDTIVEQTYAEYDDAGNAIFTRAYQRMHNATGTGPLTTPEGGQPKARVTYVAAWYDALGRQTATADYGTNGGTMPERPDTAPEGTDSLLVAFFQYNERGEAYQTIDSARRTHRQEFDHAGRLIKTVQNYFDGEPQAGLPDRDVTTLTAYNLDGRVLTLTAKNPTTGDQVTRYVYGATLAESGVARADLLRAEIYPDSDNTSIPLGNGVDGVYDRIEYTYDRLGEVLTKKDQNGTVHAYAYDAQGRLAADAATTLGQGIDGAVRRMGFGFDALGRLATATSYDAATAGDVVNQIKREYNAFGLLSTEYQEHGGAVNTSTSRKVAYAYTDGSAGHVRLTSVTYPSTWQLGYTYSSDTDAMLGRVSRLTESSGGAQLAEYTYLGAGSIVRVDYPHTSGGSAYRYDLAHGTGNDPYAGLDNLGRVIDLRWYDRTSGTTIDRVTHGYDWANNRLGREHTTELSSYNEGYSYDLLGQLTMMMRQENGERANFAQQWWLDATGNWREFKEVHEWKVTWDISQTRTHNRANEILSTTDPTMSLVHDWAGNMTVMPDPKFPVPSLETLSCAYDAWNRLVRVSDGVATVVDYVYDGLYRRVRKLITSSGSSSSSSSSSSAAVRDIYYSAGWQVLEEYIGEETSTWDLELRYVWGMRYIDDLVLRDRDATGAGTLDERLFALQDANFNVITVGGPDGILDERYRYDAYGRPIYLHVDGTENPFGSDYDWSTLFTGRSLDLDTGLYHYRYREYHHGLGRFVTRDPIRRDLSLYRYCVGSPLGDLDPLGLEDTSTWNACCPKFLKCLEEVIESLGDVGYELATTLREIDILDAKISLAKAVYRGANDANSDASVASLLWRGANGVKPITAAVVTTLGVRTITGVVTNSRMAQKGVQGFHPMSAAAKAGFKLLARVSVYATIAEWARDSGFSVLKIYQVSKTLDTLRELDWSVSGAIKAGRTQFEALDQLFALEETAFKTFDKRTWAQGDEKACSENTWLCSELKTKLAPDLQNTREWSAGVLGLTGQIDKELTNLLGLGVK